MTASVQEILRDIAALVTERGYLNVDVFAVTRTNVASVSVKWSTGDKFFPGSKCLEDALEWVKSIEPPYEAGIGPWFSPPFFPPYNPLEDTDDEETR